ncbi:oligosaccharide flippase family protein [Streptosporangium sp. 'caverna']|uniref:oligosaccharide flippase family protein n=1 Tax=Streptosporangium sp. 'caverna' TaxID=2202249 RepID=UPI001EF9B36A|nr:oligosaccharide flippase family protein [Streptosporangium sp. 'caverna']
MTGEQAAQTPAAVAAVTSTAAGTADPPPASLRRKAGRGLGWSLLGNLVMKAGSFVMGLVLARLLAPEDFGIYAVALAATNIVMVVKDLGIMAATIQWRGEIEEMAPTATLLNLFSATALYGVFWVGAPYFAATAGNPEATPVVRLLTAVILVEAITAVRTGALLRRFQQDRSSIAILAGFVVNAGVAIALAAGGAGPFSFAWGQVAAAVVTGVLVLFFAKMPFRVGFDREIAKRLLRFGIPSAAGIGLETVLANVGYVIVGNIMGNDRPWLGYYLLAFNVSSWVPGLVGTAIRQVSLAGFSRLAEGEDDELSRGVQGSVALLFATVLPLAVLMGTLAHPIIHVLYGVEWSQSAGVLRFLALLMLIRMMTSFALDILNGQGATRSTVWMNIGYGAAMVPTVIVCTQLEGIRGAAFGQAAAALLVALPLAILAVNRAGVRLLPVLPMLVRPLVGGLACFGVAMALAYLTAGNAFVTLFVAGGAGMLTYIVIVVPLDRIRSFAERGIRLMAR